MNFFRPTWIRVSLAVLAMAVLLIAASRSDPPPQTVRDSLTQAERQWLAEHPRIRVAIGSDWYPIEYWDKDGRFAGYSAAILQRVFRDLGVEIEEVKYPNWPAIVEGMKRRELDVIPTTQATPDKEAFMAYSKRHAWVPVGVLIRRGTARLERIEDLAGHTVAVVAKDAPAELLAEMHPEIRLVHFSSPQEIVKAVAEEDVYAAADNLPILSHTATISGYGNLKIGLVSRKGFDFVFGVRKDWPELVSIIDKALASVPDEEREKLLAESMRIEVEQDRSYGPLYAVLFVATGLLGGVTFWNRRLGREVRVRREAEERLGVAAQTRDRIYAVLSHDLRTPLATVLGMTDYLGKRASAMPEEELRASLRIIEEATRAGGDLVGDIHLWAQRRSEEGVGPFENVHVADLVHDVLEGVDSAARRKKIELARCGDLDVWVRAPQDPLAAVLRNLLTNGIKFTHDEGCVSVCVAASEDRVRIDVVDTGIGMTDEDVERTMRPGSLVTRRGTMGERGSGLGLLLAREFVEQWGGTLAVRSCLGEGSTFSFTVPRVLA